MFESSVLPVPAPARRTVPPSALVLGAAGLLPFAGAAVALFLVESASDRDLALRALLTYGAVILSFLGGVRWGLALSAANSWAQQSPLYGRLSLGVVPPLVAWAALFMEPGTGLMTMAGAFFLVLLADLVSTRRGEAPAWYPALRAPLTLAVMASLLVGAWA